MMKEVAVSQGEVETFTIDGRTYKVERIVWTKGGVSYDVYENETGLCLTPESLDAIPSKTEVEEILNRLRQDLTNDSLDHFYQHDIDLLCRVLSKKEGGLDATA